MESTNENYVSEDRVLSIFCADSIEVRTRITFDSRIIEGMRVTCWVDSVESSKKVTDDVFDILFSDVVRVRGVSSFKIMD